MSELLPCRVFGGDPEHSSGKTEKGDRYFYTIESHGAYAAGAIEVLRVSRYGDTAREAREACVQAWNDIQSRCATLSPTSP